MAEGKKDSETLSQEQREKIVAWLKARNAPRACSVCGHNNWTVADHLVAPPIFRPNVISLGGPAYPQAMLICANCAHTIYFNAVVMGVVTEPEKPSEKKAEPSKDGGSDG